MNSMPASEARKDFARVIAAARRGVRTVLSQHGRPVAAIVSTEDLELLQMLEDRFDNKAADAALADVEINGSVSLDELRAELGI